MNSAYPITHFLNSANRDALYIYCADALTLKRQALGAGLCRQCLFRDGDKCGANPDGDGRKVCPYLEYDPAYMGRGVRIKQRQRRRKP